MFKALIPFKTIKKKLFFPRQLHQNIFFTKNKQSMNIISTPSMIAKKKWTEVGRHNLKTSSQ